MGGYFQSLRRKIGIGTFVLACLPIVDWERSYRKLDHSVVRFDHTIYGITSYNGRLHLFRLKPLNAGPPDQWEPIQGFLPLDYLFGPEPFWRSNGLGFLINSPNNSRIVLAQRDVWTISYSYIVFPLALLSAWLLFSRPRTIVSSTIDPPPAEQES